MFIFGNAKDTISKVNRHTINLEKIFVMRKVRGLPSIIYKSSYKLERANNPKEMMTNGMNRQFTKE